MAKCREHGYNSLTNKAPEHFEDCARCHRLWEDRERKLERLSLRRNRPKKKKKKRIGVSRLDSKFSLFIRYRDKFVCQRCGTQYMPGEQGIHASHFIGRGVKSVRFDPDNCDAACYHDHMEWEARKATEYRDFKIKQLGLERFNALIERSQMTVKRTNDDYAALEVQIDSWLQEAQDAFENPDRKSEERHVPK